MDIKLSVVTPILNEENNIPELYRRLKSVAGEMNLSHEFIFIDDGSTDGSFEVISDIANKDGCVKYIRFSRNFGHQVAVMAGLDYAHGESIVIMDGDLQDPPELIKDMYKKMLEGFEVVFARRRKRKGESFLKKFTAKVFYRTLKFITTINIPLDTGDFRLIKRKVVRVLHQMPERHKFLRGQIAWAGFRQTYVDYERMERNSGQSGFSYRKMFRFAKDGIVAFSDFPLRLVTFLGFFVALIAFGVAMYTLYSKFILGGAVPGWTSLMISLLFLGGVQLISIGVIGEYIGRLADNIRKRPLYIIDTDNVNEKSEKD